MKAKLLWGLYEKAEIGFVHQHLRRDLDVVELGASASLGITGADALRHIDPDRRLVGVEANPALVPVAERTYAAHPDGRPSSVEHGAVAFGEGRVRLRIGAETQGSRLDDGSIVTASTASPWSATSRVPKCEIIERDGDALARCDSMVIELHELPEVSVAHPRALLPRPPRVRRGGLEGPVLLVGR